MTDRESLLAFVCDRPDEDGPRLMYADWCEENGQPERAEFCRVQVELASKGERPYHSPDPDCPRRFQKSDRCGSYSTGHSGNWRPIGCVDCWAELRRRERELFKDVWKWIPDRFSNVEWQIDRQHTSTRHWTDQESGSYIDLNWSRGFISAITLSWSDWLTHSPALHWQSGATMECPAGCRDGDVMTGQMASRPNGCLTCSGTGRVPRPFPATAQPIQRVSLTTMPGEIGPHRESNRYSPPGESVTFSQPQNSWTCETWRGVTFSLPAAERDRGSTGFATHSPLNG